MKKYEMENGVLINKAGITEQSKLDEFERIQTNMAERTMPKIAISYDGLKSVHHHLFQDVYEWAGNKRESILMKENTHFMPPSRIDLAMERLFNDLQNKNYIKGLNQKDLSLEIADVFGKLNNIHPFREGNGRTQRIFIKEIAKQAGYEIDFSEITKERMIQASIEFNQGNPKKMQELFVESLDKKMIENLKPFNNLLRQEKGLDGWNNLYIAHSHAGNSYHGIFVATDNITFVMQLTKESNSLERNSIIISKYDDMRHLNIKNPTTGQNITLDIPNHDKKIEKTQQVKLGETYTGKIISVDNDTITQQRAKNQPIIIHQAKSLPDVTPNDIGKKLKIVYGADGKASVSEVTRGLGKQKENLLNNEKTNQFDNDFEK